MSQRAQIYWTEKDLFNRVGASIDISCPTRRETGYCRCEKCDVCGYGKHSPMHGPIYGQPIGSAPWGHEFVPVMSQVQLETQAEILRGLGRRS